MNEPRVQLGGLLGDALAANLAGRLRHFIVDETSPAVALFEPARVAQNREGDWYGEHAGKWLVAASRAAGRSGDAELASRVRRVADWLVARQAPDGYLGNYAPGRRFTDPRPPRRPSWDGAPALRTWDVWTHSHLVLGLLAAHRQFARPEWLEAARRIGELCHRTLAGGTDITELGNHHGLSATVLLDPAAELYFATGEPRWLELARLVLEQANRRPELRLLDAALEGADAAEIGTGKAYQLCWNLQGIAKLHRATGEPHLLAAARNVWRDIRAHHLTPGGGPWGGVAHRSREVFNHRGAFSPYGYVETCSTCAWILLNGELLRITGDAACADEIERAAYNDLLGAQAPDGENWCYYSFPNGRRVHATEWRCCKSSGALALEALPALAYAALAGGDLAVNLYAPGSAGFGDGEGEIRLEQATRYPFDSDIAIRVLPARPRAFGLRLRIPGWAKDATLAVNGEASGEPLVPESFVTIRREWRPGDEVRLRLPMRPVFQSRASRSVQEARTPDGTPVVQEVLNFDYIAVTRGPLVYASGLIDGYKVEETLRLPPGSSALTETPGDAPDGPGLELAAAGRTPLVLVPYYRAGGRANGAWRLTWFQTAPVK